MKNGSPIPLCSVCIANYNGEEYLSACLESILSQEFAYPVEIIIHDDASTDNSVTLIQSRYPQIKLIQSEKNVGFCVSNNRMVATAEGNFILLLNNDAALHKDALKTLYAASQCYGDGIFGLPQYNAETGELIDIGSVFDPFLNPIPNKDRERQDVGMIIGACLWLPKTLWDELGGFPEWFESLAEDMYICCLARLWGYPVRALPESGFDHWVGKSLGGGKVLANRTLETSKKRRALSERNKTFVMIICYPVAMIWFIFPIHLVLLVLEGSLFALVKQDKQLWTGIYRNCLKAIWQRRIKLYDKRKAIQKLRKITLGEFSRAFTLFPHKLRMLLKFGFPQVD